MVTSPKTDHPQIPPLSDAPSVHTRVEHWLRRQIQGRDFAIGSRIPPVRDLARQFDASVCTIHRALTPLVADGLLERRHGSGMYVRNVDIQLKCLAFYSGHPFSSDASDSFIIRLFEEMRRRLDGRGVMSRIWMDSVEGHVSGMPPPGLAEAASTREIQGLMVLSRNRKAQPWIERLGLPTAIHTMGPHPTRVGFNVPQMARMVVDTLVGFGGRRAALISNLTTAGEPAPLVLRFFETIRDEADRRALDLPDSRIVCPDPLPEKESMDMERFGYEAFRRLWAREDRPDGLVVTSDVAARGVVVAMSELGVRPPSGLRVAFHRNEGVNLFAPFPYTALEASPRACAEAALALIDRQLRGQPPAEISLPQTRVEYWG